MLRSVVYWGVPACAIAAVFSLWRVDLAGAAAADPAAEAKLAEYRNLGKAFYENPTTQNEAVAQFKKALDLKPNSVREQLNYALALLRAAKIPEALALLEKVQKEDPALPHTWFNLGVYYKGAGEFDKSLEQFQRMAKLVPAEAITHYNIGTLYKLENKPDAAREEFERARDLNPSLAAPHFQLFNLYRQQGRMDDARRELQLFNERKKAQENDAIPKEDVDWSEYAEIYDPLTPEPASPKEPVSFRFAAKQARTTGTGNSGLIVLDAFGTGGSDLLAFSPAGLTLYKAGATKVAGTGLEGVTGVTGVIPGDFNNDGFTDLCLLMSAKAVLYENHAGKFSPAKFELPAGAYNTALWIDFDHDYDLDLMLLGANSVLLRNQGDAGFEKHAFPFASGEALSAVAFRLVADTKSKDLAITYRDQPATLYLDQLTGEYKARELPQIPSGAVNLRAMDLDNDGSLDLAFTAGGKTSAVRNQKTGFGDAVLIGPESGVFADLGNRGFSDFASGSSVQQNTAEFHFVPAAAVSGIPAGIQSAVAADFNGDGLTDLAVARGDGAVALLENETATANRWLRVKIDGVKNLKLPLGSEIEVKAAASYQKKIYTGVPLLFGLAGHQTADAVRITWPNGLIQNEMNQATNKNLAFKEAQRLSGSCPLIFTWNGKEFQYITDVLGVAPLGAMSGDGQFFPTDHTEYISLPAASLAPKRDATGQDAYEIHLTEELSEVSYFDQVQLVAVDHPAPIEIYSNEKWKSPPFPQFRLYGLEHRLYPVRARSAGGDVLPRLLARDKKYVDDFEHNYIGVAELHTLDLDFGQAAPDNRAFLVLNGWVDWADGSTFLQQAQEKHDLKPPSLQVKDQAGKWVTVIDDMGMPSGKPKTIAVDLTGKFLSASRQMRIVTNMCVYWDEIYLGENAQAPDVRLTLLTPDESSVHFRGFSPSHIHPERKEPEYFDYLQPTTTSYWNPTPGKYTRYGDTTELTRDIDDRLVVMGSGDMLSLRFNSSRLAPPAPGWKRDYLLRVEGWAKDRDANTAFSQSVEPLPFHAMSRYPYPADERFPGDALHQAYVRQYLTRPALRLLRPLAPQ